MSIYEQNLLKLKDERPDLYGALQEEDSDKAPFQVLVGDALDGEKFLAVLDGEKIVPLSSTYHPTHEAERFSAQFKKRWGENIVFLFGMGQVEIIRYILSENCPIDYCIVYEPSVAIFHKIMEEYDIQDLIDDSKLKIFVEGLNEDQVEGFLHDEINYSNWRQHYFVNVSKYQSLFQDSFQTVHAIYNRVIDNRIADMNTLIVLAQAGMQNEIHSFRWMIRSKTLDSLKEAFPKDVPYIVVAAGPSLEKNVGILKQAKGKAVIVCVDTALNFLLEQGIIPDMACTIDARKELHYFIRPELKDIPMMISTDSNYRALELAGDFMPIYISTTNDFALRLFKERQRDITYFDGGGSVATVCFQMGVRLGFKTIVLVGQDLALTDQKAHAGMGKVTKDDLQSDLKIVEAYDGGEVLTRLDFKHYIDWYNMVIPQLKDQTVINATEGGAKLKGTVQMSLQEVVDIYCKKECDIKKMLEQAPMVWDTMEEKARLYWEIKNKFLFFKDFHRKLQDGVSLTQRAIMLLKRGNYQQKDLQNIDKKLDVITKMTAEKEGIVILVKRMIETEITLNDDLLDVDENPELESIRLYGKMQTYLKGLLEAVEELLPIWEDVMRQINDTYGFE